MLIRPAFTNRAPAEAAILPGASTSTRAQVAREWHRLRLSRTEAGDIGRAYVGPLCRENEKQISSFFQTSAEAQRPPGFGCEQFAVCSLVAAKLTNEEEA